MKLEELKALYDKAMEMSRERWAKDNSDRGTFPTCGFCWLDNVLGGACSYCAFGALGGHDDELFCSNSWRAWRDNPTPENADAVLAEVESITWERFLEYMKTVIEVEE